MNRKNGIVLFVLMAVVIIGILVLISGGGDGELAQLRRQMGQLKAIIASYQAEEERMPASNQDLLDWDEAAARAALADPWRPGQLLDLRYGRLPTVRSVVLALPVLVAWG